MTDEKDPNYIIQHFFKRNNELLKEHTKTHFICFIDGMIDTANAFMRMIFGLLVSIFTLLAEVSLHLQKIWVRKEVSGIPNNIDTGNV